MIFIFVFDFYFIWLIPDTKKIILNYYMKNSNIKVVVVATHNERFFDSFKDSCKKNGIEPVILGWGKKYTGHLMKDDMLIEYLENNKNNDIILFVDAFDCLVIQHIELLKQAFLKSKKKIIISCEDNIQNKSLTHIFTYIQNMFFGSVNKNLINTGMFVGYRDDLLKSLNIIRTYRENHINSNQRIWTNALNNSKNLRNLIHIDKNEKFFINFTILKDTNFNYLKKKKPFVIQGNGFLDLNKFCKKLGYKKSEIKISNMIKYSINFLFYYFLPYIIYLFLGLCIYFVIRKTIKDFTK